MELSGRETIRDRIEVSLTSVREAGPFEKWGDEYPDWLWSRDQ